MQGFAPDAQVVGGVGFGLGAKLKNFFLARGRLGLLYADEPWMVNLGATVEVGALGRFGAGGEIELNADRGLFGAVGLARVAGKEWMTHVSVGFTVLGIEWQHRFGDERPSDALLFEVRLPIGTWWFVKQHEPPASRGPTTGTGYLQPRVIAPRAPPSAAGGALAPEARGSASQGAASSPGIAGAPAGTTSQVTPEAGKGGSQAAASSPAGVVGVPAAATPPVAPDAGNTMSQSAAPEAGPQAPSTTPPSAAERQTAVLVPAALDPARVQEAHALVERARAARERGESGQAALLLARAYTLSPEPMIALQLSAAEEAHGRWLLAAGDLRRALAAHTLPDAEQRRVSEQLAELEARTPKLRLILDRARGDEVVTIDGERAPAATLGYDVPVDPGEHVVLVTRRGRELARGNFSAVPEKLARVTLELTNAP